MKIYVVCTIEPVMLLIHCHSSETHNDSQGYIPGVFAEAWRSNYVSLKTGQLQPAPLQVRPRGRDQKKPRWDALSWTIIGIDMNRGGGQGAWSSVATGESSIVRPAADQYRFTLWLHPHYIGDVGRSIEERREV